MSNIKNQTTCLANAKATRIPTTAQIRRGGGKYSVNLVCAKGNRKSLAVSKKLAEGALKVHYELAKHFMVDYDESGSIGKRYRREDEIGTPFCITYDFESEEDGCVTVRDRDSMEQVRMPISEVRAYIESKIAF